MTNERFALNDLDTLATEAYPGLVVRKDLLRRMRTAFGVPAFVIEFLLGKYCASTDDETIREGLEFVRETLAGKYVKPDEREAVKSAIKQHTSFEIIDKISVRLIETHDKYWARLSNLDLDYVNIEESEVRRHDRLLMGGIWAEVTLRYDDAYIFKNQNRPFFIESIRPIQISSRKLAVPALGAVVCVALFLARAGAGDWRAPAISGVLLLGVGALYLWIRPRLAAEEG